MKEKIHAIYYNIQESEQKRSVMQTGSQAKTSGTILPKLHGVNKGVEPSVKPEKYQ